MSTLKDWDYFSDIDKYLEPVASKNKYMDTFDNYENNKVAWFLLALFTGVAITFDPTLSVKYEKESNSGENDTSKERVDL